jgi:hypothetical protein
MSSDQPTNKVGIPRSEDQHPLLEIADPPVRRVQLDIASAPTNTPSANPAAVSSSMCSFATSRRVLDLGSAITEDQGPLQRSPAHALDLSTLSVLTTESGPVREGSQEACEDDEPGCPQHTVHDAPPPMMLPSPVDTRFSATTTPAARRPSLECGRVVFHGGAAEAGANSVATPWECGVGLGESSIEFEAPAVYRAARPPSASAIGAGLPGNRLRRASSRNADAVALLDIASPPLRGGTMSRAPSSAYFDQLPLPDDEIANAAAADAPGAPQLCAAPLAPSRAGGITPPGSRAPSVMQVTERPFGSAHVSALNSIMHSPAGPSGSRSIGAGSAFPRSPPYIQSGLEQSSSVASPTAHSPASVRLPCAHRTPFQTAATHSPARVVNDTPAYVRQLVDHFTRPLLEQVDTLIVTVEEVKRACVDARRTQAALRAANDELSSRVESLRFQVAPPPPPPPPHRAAGRHSRRPSHSHALPMFSSSPAISNWSMTGRPPVAESPTAAVSSPLPPAIRGSQVQRPFQPHQFHLSQLIVSGSATPSARMSAGASPRNWYFESAAQTPWGLTGCSNVNTSSGQGATVAAARPPAVAVDAAYASDITLGSPICALFAATDTEPGSPSPSALRAQELQLPPAAAGPLAITDDPSPTSFSSSKRRIPSHRLHLAAARVLQSILLGAESSAAASSVLGAAFVNGTIPQLVETHVPGVKPLACFHEASRLWATIYVGGR